MFWLIGRILFIHWTVTRSNRLIIIFTEPSLTWRFISFLCVENQFPLSWRVSCTLYFGNLKTIHHFSNVCSLIFTIYFGSFYISRNETFCITFPLSIIFACLGESGNRLLTFSVDWLDLICDLSGWTDGVGTWVLLSSFFIAHFCARPKSTREYLQTQPIQVIHMLNRRVIFCTP